MEITSTKTIGVDSLKFLIIGKGGSGKTSLAATITEPVLIISAASGLLSLKDYDIPVININIDKNGKQLTSTERLEKLGQALEFVQKEEIRKKYKWLFIDSISEIGESLYEHLKTKYPEKKDSYAMYGEYGDKLEVFIKKFRDLSYYNVVFTCDEMVDKDENGKRVITAALSGRLATKVFGFFDEVFYLDMDQSKSRFLQTQANQLISARDRSGKLDAREIFDIKTRTGLQAIAKKINGTAPSVVKTDAQVPSVTTTKSQ